MSLAVDTLELGPIGTNTYVVRTSTDSRDAVVIDPSGDAGTIGRALDAVGARCSAILVTHGHFDHIVSLADLAALTDARVYAPAGERMLLEDPTAFTPPGLDIAAATADVWLEGGEAIDAAGISFAVTLVPGHSPAHLAYYAEGELFSGDVLFAGSVGRTDLPGGDWNVLEESIRSLLDAYPAETVVRPGHGPSTTLAGERRANPFLAGLRDERAGRMSDRIERPRGTHDVVPSEMPLWQRVTGEIERLCDLYGYRKILTPVFEDTALFARTSGQGSDVVQKEMYSFTDRSDRPLTLRPEGTAPICRAYVEHGMHRDPQPRKLYTIAPMYRYGAPGRGRYREHWQASVEAIGTDDPAIDAELLQLYDTLLHRLGVTSYHLELNSIGCATCRPAYHRAAARLARRERAPSRRWRRGRRS